MKQQCPTYLKTIRKSKTLVATLSDIEPENDLDDNEEDLVDSKFEKMND